MLSIAISSVHFSTNGMTCPHIISDIHICTWNICNISDSVFSLLCLSTRALAREKLETSLWAQFIHLSKRRLFLLHIGVLHILCVWKTAWTISGIGTITIYTFNESLCGKVMVGWVMGYGTIRRHWFREEEGVTCYVNSLRYLSTDKLTQSDSVIHSLFSNGSRHRTRKKIKQATRISWLGSLLPFFALQLL